MITPLMALSQQKFREIVFQLVYSHDFAQNEMEDMLPLLMKQLAVTKKSICMAEEKASDLRSKLSEIDQKITTASVSYGFERIPRIEKNILRLGVYELCFTDLPPKVAISEAIRLSRKYATRDGATFVNAVLDAIYKVSGR